MKFNVPDSLKYSSGIYIITAKNSNDFYIGSALNFHNRFMRYKSTLKNKFYMSEIMNDFVNENGYKNLLFSVYAEVKNIEKIGIIEKFIIQNLEPPLNSIHSSRKGTIKGKQYFKNVVLHF